MPHRQHLALATTSRPQGAGDSPPEVLVDSVSAASLSFVQCGVAVSDLGDLLNGLRLALQVREPEGAGPDRRQAAALLAARLESVRRALDGATTAIESLLGASGPEAGPAPRPSPPASRGCNGTGTRWAGRSP